MTDLYRCFSSNYGYIVYRALVDKPHLPVEQVARAHKVAVFVDESEALDYCRYRNELTERLGSDALPDRAPHQFP